MGNTSPYKPDHSAAHVAFIDNLGGPKAVSDYINEQLDTKLTGNAISMWRMRGIPYRYRGLLVVRANQEGVEVPPDFFGLGSTGT